MAAIRSGAFVVVQGIGKTRRFLTKLTQSMDKVPSILTQADKEAINQIMVASTRKDFHDAAVNSPPISLAAGILSRVENYYGQTYNTLGKLISRTNQLRRLQDTGRLARAMVDAQSPDRKIVVTAHTIALVIAAPGFKKQAFGARVAYRFGSIEHRRFKERVGKPPKRIRLRSKFKTLGDAALKKKLASDLNDYYDAMAGRSGGRRGAVFNEGGSEAYEESDYIERPRGKAFDAEVDKLFNKYKKELAARAKGKKAGGSKDPGLVDSSVGARIYYKLLHSWEKEYPRTGRVRPRLKLTTVSYGIRERIVKVFIARIAANLKSDLGEIQG